METCLGEFLNQWRGGWRKWRFCGMGGWSMKVDGHSAVGLEKWWHVWPQIFSLKHAVPSLPHQAGSGHISLRGSRCLRTSALVATALCWRADFIFARNLILVSRSFVWTRTLLLEASCVQGAGCWLRWWHEREADKICIASGSFISKGLFAAVAGKWNHAASSLARDRECSCHEALQVASPVNLPQMMAK